MTPAEIRAREPAFGGGGTAGPPAAQLGPDEAAELAELNDVAPEDRDEVRSLIAQGVEPRLIPDANGLLHLDRSVIETSVP